MAQIWKHLLMKHYDYLKYIWIATIGTCSVAWCSGIRLRKFECHFSGSSRLESLLQCELSLSRGRPFVRNAGCLSLPVYSLYLIGSASARLESALALPFSHCSIEGSYEARVSWPAYEDLKSQLWFKRSLKLKTWVEWKT